MSHYSYIYCFITMPIKLLKWELLVASNGPDLFFHIIFLHYIHHFYMLYNQQLCFQLLTMELFFFLRFFLSLIFRLNASLSSCYHTLSSSLLRNLLFFLPTVLSCNFSASINQNVSEWRKQKKNTKNCIEFSVFFFVCCAWNNMNTGYIFVLGLQCFHYF